MFCRVNDFIESWKYESGATLKVFEELNDKSLTKKDHSEVRSMSVLAWHITTTVYEMMNKAGLNVEVINFEGDEPGSRKFIIDSYKKIADSLILEIEKKWKDSELSDKIPMYGEEWTKGQTLSTLINHQAHHRGQLTVLMRLAGCKVPGVYGPSKEEWSQMGLAPMK